MSKLFGSDDINKIIKDADDAKNNAGNFKKSLEPGKYILTLADVSIEHSKKDGNAMVKLVFKANEETRELREIFKIAGPNTDIARQLLVKMFYRGFNYTIQPCDSTEELLKQLIKFKGKTLSAVVKGTRKAISFKDKETNEDAVLEIIEPEVWYVENTAGFNELSFDSSKIIKDLSDDDKERLSKFAEINGGPYVPVNQRGGTKEETRSTSKVEAEVKKEVKASAPETQKAHDDDDDSIF